MWLSEDSVEKDFWRRLRRPLDLDLCLDDEAALPLDTAECVGVTGGAGNCGSSSQKCHFSRK